MFDVGFSELLVIAVVALLVLGPERLPKAARFAGLWVRKAREQWNSVKSEFERDLADEDLKRSLHETQDALRDAQASLRNAGSACSRNCRAPATGDARHAGGGDRRRVRRPHRWNLRDNCRGSRRQRRIAAAPEPRTRNSPCIRRWTSHRPLTMPTMKSPALTTTGGRLLDHLIELRSRLLRAVAGLLLLFVALLPFANRLYSIAGAAAAGQAAQGRPADRDRGRVAVLRADETRLLRRGRGCDAVAAVPAVGLRRARSVQARTQACAALAGVSAGCCSTPAARSRISSCCRRFSPSSTR